MKIEFARRVEKDLRKLSPSLATRIIEKLEFYAGQTRPLDFAEPLVNNPYGNVRFRVGDYRVICDIAHNTILVTAIGHRREIYR